MIVGLKINSKKTQWLVVGKKVNTDVKVEDYKYLGVWIKWSPKEFNIRKALAWDAAKVSKN